jgi:BASS family bile acid:Na+ symporter
VEAFSYSYIDFFIMLVLASIMFGLGLSLTPASFRNIMLFPRAFISGLAAQMIALPLFAYLILLVPGIPGEFKVGLMILAACPGGTTSGFVTYLFRGNVALSISLTAVNSILTLFSIPFIVNLALWHYMGKLTELHLPIISSIVQIFFVTLLPAFLGVFVREWKPGFALRLEKRMKYILLVLLGAVYSIKFFANEQAGGTGLILSEIGTILPYTLIFNVVCFVFGIYFGKITRLAVRDAFTVAIEVSLHNTTLAILIGGTMLQNQEMVKPALIYSMFSFWTAIIFGMITRRIYRNRLTSNEKPG